MSILGGVLGLASSGLTAATQAAGGYEQGKQQGSMLLRAMQQQDDERQLRDLSLAKQGIMPGQAPTTASIPVDGPGGTVNVPGRYRQLTPKFYEDQTRTPEALAEKLASTKATALAGQRKQANAALLRIATGFHPELSGKFDDLDLGETDPKDFRELIQNQLTPRPWQPASKQDAIDVRRRGLAPPKEPTPHYSVTTGVDPKTGKPAMYRVNTLSGEVTPVGVERPATTGGDTAQGAMARARIGTARTQSAEADRILTAYEDKVLGHQAQFTTADAALAQQALRGSVVSERLLNAKNPEMAGYIRAVKAMATAERRIDPRGSNALQSAETFLSGAGPGATPALIQQARRFRQTFMQGLGSDAPPPGTDGPASHPIVSKYGITPPGAP